MVLVYVIYTNLAKAFNKINHKILFIKVKQICIYGYFLSWIITFIKDYLQIELVCSNTRYIGSFSRIPHLTPILFLTLINDINFKNCTKLMFVDYLKLFRTINNQVKAYLLQSNLNTLYK